MGGDDILWSCGVEREGGICLHFRDAEIEVSLGRALSEWIGGELRDEKEGFVCVFIP